MKGELIARMPVEVGGFSGKGRVYSFSTVYDPPERFEDYVPYTVAIIELEEGPLVTARLTDVDNNGVYIGMPVEMVTRILSEDGERGLINYGYNFRPPIPRSEGSLAETIERIESEEYEFGLRKKS